jgi:PAS domain S-box-containing protein
VAKLRRTQSVPHPSDSLHLSVLLIFAAVVGFFGYRFYATERQALDLDLHNHLQEIVDLKANEIAAWRLERLGDAQVAAADSRLMPLLQRILRGHDSPEVRDQVLGWMNAMRTSYQYANVVLTDSTGHLRVSSGQLLGTPELYTQLTQEAIGSKDIVFRDVAADGQVSKSHFVLGAGLRSEDGQPFGAVLLGIDPWTFLYPVILKWPSTGKTGEAVLVRRDQDQALFLNDLQRSPGAAMKMRIPLTNQSTVGVKAALGQQGRIDGLDYSGARVLASAKQVPDSPWFVLAKMDEDEALQPLRQTGRMLWLITGSLILIATAGIALIRRHQISTFYRQRYEAEQERRALLGHYDYLTRFANDAILLLADDGRILEVNERATDRYGFSREELLQMNVRQLRPLDRRADFERTWQIIHEQEGLVYETENQRKDGSRFPVEVSTKLIESEGKRYCQSIVRDISERKQTEEQIRRLNRLYLVLSQCGQAIIHAQTESELYQQICRIAAESGGLRIAYVGLIDPRTQRVTPIAQAGGGAAFLDGVSLTAADDPSGPLVCNDILTDSATARWREIASQHAVRSSIALPLRRDGRVIGQLGLYSSEAHFFSQEEVKLANEIAETVSYALDALEQDRQRQQAEADLRISRERLELALDATNDGYWDWNLQTRENHVSPRYATMLGYEPGEVAGGYTAWRDMIHPADTPIMDEALKKLTEGRLDKWSIEIRAQCKSGAYIWILCRAKVVARAESGALVRVVGTHTDITERKKLEEQFLQAQKLESVGRLAGGVAHDFNNLLTVINGYAELLLSRLEPGNPLQTMAKAIGKAGESAVSLTHQLLAFSRMQVTQPKPIHLNSVLADSEKMLTRLVGEDIEVVTVLSAEPDNILADPNQIHQCLMNLVVNARDAMPGGGRLVVETSNIDVDAPDFSSDAELTPGPYIQLAVTDNGTGMDQETRRRIFEPFFTTKEQGKGTGLGLSTVYGIVRQCNGFIRVESELGRGSQFQIYLPLTTSDVGAVEGVLPSQPQSAATETILLVEDQENVRAFLSEALHSFGYSVLEASSGADALAMIVKHPEPIHLLLTDVVMPGMNGKELAERLRPLRPGIRVLFMSGYSGDVITNRGGLAEGLSYIAKPFAPEVLAAKIREVLNPSGRQTILVVDDQESVRNLFEDILTASYHVLLASDGQEALNILRRGEPIDLVITDLVMPNTEGIETIQAIRKEYPGVKIIAMSGALGGHFLKPALLVGADATLEKPIPPDVLQESIKEVLSRAN